MQRFQPIEQRPGIPAVTFLSSLAFCIGLMAAVLLHSSAAHAQSAATTAKPLQIVAFGDSLVAGYGVGPGDSFPEQLQKALQEKGYDVVVTNAGESGGTTTGGLARLEWSVPAEADLVIVELGANDALRGISPQITRDNLDGILAKLKERGQAVVLAGMLAPPNMGRAYSQAFDPIYADLAKKYDVPLYPFFLEGVAAQPELNQDDAMHPNAEGVSVIVQNMMATITEALDRLKTRQQAG